ncbi:MAG: glycosyltransferase, partial [Azonexus sp.]
RIRPASQRRSASCVSVNSCFGYANNFTRLGICACLNQRFPREGIEVVGEVPAERFFDLMRLADIVTMPSYDEPFGLIAQEAMLLRRLLVVSGSGGLMEFTGDDCAVVIEPKSVSSLQKGLMRAITLMEEKEAAIRISMLDRAQARVDTFHPARVACHLEDIYDKACGMGVGV